MKTVKTEKGTVLPLIQLKGKDYLQVAHRLQWFVEQNTRYAITTTYLHLDATETVAKVTVNLFNDQGQLLKTAEGTKRECKADFNDHTEKAETGALGRALVQLGYGTQYALADLDEGTRIVDSPVTDVRTSGFSRPVNSAPQATTVTTTENTTPLTVEAPKAKSSFRKPKKTAEAKPTNGNGSNSEEEFFS